MEILLIVAGLANLVCFIWVLVKLFADKGPLHGILGIVCSIYTFFWGWVNVSEQNITPVMLVWTISIVAGMVAQTALV
ncbi:MAG: hypothetical protein QNJ45_13305 [Ardenticatenaceae bacterium]|nr:hypothetical protein [Ardenticatenaceae bacterium]